MSADAIVAKANALRAQGLLADEDKVLAAAVLDFPESEPIAALYGWSAQRQRNWAEAVARWVLYRERFPDRFLGYALGIAALRETQRYPEAETLAREGLQRFPRHPEIIANFAWIADRQGDHAEALRRWQSYIEASPDDALGYLFSATALRATGSLDLADEVLRQGLEKAPSNAELLGLYAWIAYDRQDWPEALRRWRSFREQHPENPLGHQQVAAVLGWMDQFGDADAQTSRASKERPLPELMLRFESLGDNCEFGLVQRHFGVEPLGLLRWTGIAPAHLVNALDSDFDGVGDEARTNLDLAGNEYVTENVRFGMRMHTFIPGSISDRDRIFAQQCRRLRFLRSKMLEDLKTGEKIFVYKQREGRLSETEMWAISRALRRHGSNRLLCVVLADGAYPAGTLRRMDDLLEIGYIGRLSPTARHDEVAYDSWLELLQRSFAV